MTTELNSFDLSHRRIMSAQAFVDEVVARLERAGIYDAKLLKANYSAESFGNSEAIFSVGSLVLRVVRDRGQEFLELATSAAPEQFYQFGDVEIAMRWKTIGDVLGEREPEGFDSTFGRLREHIGELTQAFVGPQERLTRARIEKVTKERAEEFLRRIRG